MTVNPVHMVSRPKGVVRYRHRRWEDEEIEAILKAAKFDEDKKPEIGYEFTTWALLICIETAMRPKELCSLYVRDFFPKRKMVAVRESKNDHHKEVPGRNVPLNRRAIQLITFITEGREPDDKIIPITEATLGAYYRELRKKAGLANADLRFYDARHEATTRLSEKLANPLELSAVTGHKSLQSLKFYYNPKPEDLAAKLG